MLSVSVCHFLRRFGSAGTVVMLAGAAGAGAGTYRGTINDVAL